MYNDNTDNLNHCKMHILCAAVSSIFAQFSVDLQKKRNDTSYILYYKIKYSKYEIQL